MLTETHQNAKEELQAAVIQLEGQIKQHISNEHALTSEIENMKAEVEEKSALSERLKELEEQLAITKAQVKEEVIYFTPRIINPELMYNYQIYQMSLVLKPQN